MSSDSDYGIEIGKYKNYVLINFINYQKLDLYNARDLVEVFKIQNENGIEEIAIDMSPINYVDSSGLGALASQGMYLGKKSKKLNLIGVKSGVGHLFKTSDFERIFRIIPDKESL